MPPEQEKVLIMKTILFLSLVLIAPSTFAANNCQLKEVQDVRGEPWGRGRDVSRSSIETSTLDECSIAAKALLGREDIGVYLFTGRRTGKNGGTHKHRTDLHAKFTTIKVVMKHYDVVTDVLTTIRFR